MKYHNTHGTAIALSGNRSIATRNEGIFCNGICFGDQQLKANQKVCLELSTKTSWSGALGIGVTTNNPSKINQADLPRFAYHNLLERDGYWIKAVNEKLIQNGSKLMIYSSSSGSLQLFIDGDHKGALLSTIPTDKQLWLVVDIYGNTTGAKFVKPDEAPKEILARGPEAIMAYEEACTSGIKVVHRTRLMLVGHERVGKTSLKKSLIGLEHDINEAATEGIDLSFSCSFNKSHRSTWQAEIQGNKHNDRQNDSDKIENSDALEEQYYYGLAENIVKEMAKQKAIVKSRTSSKDSLRILSLGRKSDKEKQNVRGSTQSSTSSQCIPPSMVVDVPDRVVELVQEMLDKQEGQVSPGKNLKYSRDSKVEPPETVDKKELERTVMLNIWDFAGQSAYYTTHQVFLTFRAVYIIVFNLCLDLYSSQSENDMNTLDYMDYWLKTIHSHISDNTRSQLDNTRLSPPVFIVGTHRNSLGQDPHVLDILVEEKFSVIREFLQEKPYSQHIITPFIAVENNLDTGIIDIQIDTLRQKIEDIATEEQYMGETIPLKWLRFEQEVSRLVVKGTKYASYDQIQEVARTLGIGTMKEFRTMLEFYHDLGVILYYGSAGTLDTLLLNTIILKPQWLVDMFTRIVTAKPANDKWNLSKDRWRMLNEKGKLEESLIDSIWKDSLEEKLLLLGLMDKFDLICECLSEESEVGCAGRYKPKMFYIPSRITTTEKSLYTSHPNHAVFYFNFNDNLPEGLYHRMVTRMIRWSQESFGKEPHGMIKNAVRFYFDQEHDFVLELAPSKCHRIKVVVIKVTDLDIDLEMEEEAENEEDNVVFLPKSVVCAKIRNLLETNLYDIKEIWMKRLKYSTCVQCPCDKCCNIHGNPECQDVRCIHLLSLDECLLSKVVCCEHRRVKTNHIQKFFPEPADIGLQGKVLPQIEVEKGNVEKYSSQLPFWIKGAAKLLNAGNENQDWMALAKLMGYKEEQIDVLLEDTNPPLAFLADWILAGGNTTLAVDMLVGYLEKIDRDDVIDVISSGQVDTKQDPPIVFISYQWDIQDEVNSLRDKLEKSGFSCWMDVGQMGGGDQLGARIDSGVRNCKVFLACLTPKYVISHHCNRELSLADLLKKPIIPVMFESVEWPPPGGMSLIFSQLVYIQMKGVGGHGGFGINADLNDKYREIINKILMFANPDLSKYFENETLLSISSKESEIMEEIRSMNSHNSHERLLQDIAEQFSARDLNLTRAYLPPPVTMRSVAVMNDDIEQQPSPQVHVSKCSVCTIL